MHIKEMLLKSYARDMFSWYPFLPTVENLNRSVKKVIIMGWYALGEQRGKGNLS